MMIVATLQMTLSQPLWLSVRIAVVATVLLALSIIPIAYWLARARFAGRALVEGLLMAPLVLPPTVIGYLLIAAFGARGWLSLGVSHFLYWDYSILFRFEGAVLAAAVVGAPMLYIPTKAAFSAVDRDLEEVARLMGAGPLQTFWHVSLPLARRGIISGLVLAFARALGEFGATMMVFGSGERHLTLPISIYLDFENGELSRALPAVVAMALTSLALVLLYNSLLRRD